VVNDRDGVLGLKGRRQGLEDPLDRLEKDGRHDDVDRSLELDDLVSILQRLFSLPMARQNKLVRLLPAKFLGSSNIRA
jgi:hypothetical protein